MDKTFCDKCGDEMNRGDHHWKPEIKFKNYREGERYILSMDICKSCAEEIMGILAAWFGEDWHTSNNR